MRREVVEETKNMDSSVKGEEYVYHYIEYRLFKPPKEVRITKYNGGMYDGETKQVVVIHKGEWFSLHVKPKIPFKKQLIKIPFKLDDFAQLYDGNIETVNIDCDDAGLKKNGISKDIIEQLYYMKIANHYKEINDYYANLNKALAQEREARERRESRENELLEAYRRQLDANHERYNAETAVDTTIRELDEEDENHEGDDDFFAGLDDNG